MDDVRARENAPQLDAFMVEQEKIDAATSHYLERVDPFSLRFDAPAPLVPQELAIRWPIKRGTEEQASNLRHQIEDFVKPLTETIHPGAIIRLIINVGAHPEVQVPFPDAPAVYAAFDASRGIVRHRFAAANEIPLDAWVETIPRGMTLLCQPSDTKSDQFPNVLGQGDNLYELTAKEQNETAEWRRTHNRAIIVPMMPFTAKSEQEAAADLHYQEAHKGEDTLLAGAALFAGYEYLKNERNPAREAEEAQKRRKENDDKIAEQNKQDSDKMAEKNKEDAAIQAEEAAIARVEFLLNEVRRDERLIRENPGLSSELAALSDAAIQLRSVLREGPNEERALSDIHRADEEYKVLKEPETVYDERSKPEQIFMGMPEKETEVQESEQAREDAEHFPEEVTSPGEYARIADLNPEAAEELTAEEPGLRQYAVNEDMVESGAETAPGEAAAERASTEGAEGMPETAVSEAANEVTLSPEAAAERAQETAPESVAERAAEEIGGAREIPETAETAGRAGEEATGVSPERAEEITPQGETAAEAPESKIAEPAANNVEGRELEGGAPLNEAGEPIQNAPEAIEQPESPAVQEEVPSEDPITEKAKEEARDEALRPAESENEPTSSEHTETGGTTETTVPEREPAAAPESRIAEPAASNVEGRELQGGAPLNEEGQPIQNAPEFVEQPESPAVQEEASSENPITERVKEEARDEALRPAESENNTVPSAERTETSEAAPARDEITQPSNAEHIEPTGNTETAAQEREPAAESARPENEPQATVSEREPVTTENTSTQDSAQEAPLEQPAEQTTAEGAERTAPVTEQTSEPVSETSGGQSTGQETSTSQDQGDGFHDVLHTHHMAEMLGEGAGGAAGLHHIAATTHTPVTPAAPSGILAKAGAAKARALAGRLRPARQSPSSPGARVVARGAKAKAASSSRKQDKNRRPTTKAAPTSIRRPKQKVKPSSDAKPEPEPDL